MKLLNLLPKKSRFMSMSLALLASATLLSSCLKSDNDNGTGTPASGLSFVHAAATQPSVSLYVDGKDIFSPQALPYGQFSQYLTAGPGNHLIQTMVGGTSQKLTEATVSLAEGKYHTVFIANRSDNDSLTTVMITDPISAASAGKAKIRFVQLSPSTEEYDLYLQGGSVLFNSKAYKESTDFVEIDPAKYKFAARLVGATDDKAVTEEVDVKAGGFYTVVLAGKASVTSGTTGALKAFTVAL